MKFTVEVLSLLAFLLGSPVYLPRLVDAAPASKPTTVKTDSRAAQPTLPATK